MSGKTDRRITFLSLTTAALPPDGSGVAWWLAWCGGRWFSTQYEAETFVFSRIYCNIRKPLMPIRYPIAFRGTARPSVCSAWRHKVPKKERLTHPKPYVVPKTRCFAETFCLFLPYLLKPKPSLFVELGAVVHQRETSVRFRHQRNLQAFFVTFCLFAF